MKKLFEISGREFITLNVIPAILFTDNYQPNYPPDGYKLQPLSKDKVDDVYASWGHDGNRKIVERLAERKKILGLFLPESTNSVSWVVDYSNPVGFIGILYTAPEYRNRGLAKVVISGVVDMILSCGPYIPFCFFDNEEKSLPSRKAFSRLGFDISDCPISIIVPQNSA